MKNWCSFYSWYFQFFGNLENMIREQIAKGVSLRASSNLAKLALLVWVSNFAFELQGKYLVVLFLD